ncbi:GlxA family transcriptional regulator [Ramlibacter rhizophilus]|uniref:Helix-turn-helix domain-containing protein n=1 Tax=Ramlibacter rhizophilus TaxID=1781167 RepID=A0A4Z0BVC9_9BURK|nr:helix-turn-helix domain-containing protein [Ramlibacter rhizophilus]TFZ03267.1 helix-turn-helix domain-containing protein [Ramlibacter rhizophilus]
MSDAPAQAITVALLAVEESSAATLYGFYDALASVRRDWSLLHGEPVQPSPFRPVVVSLDGQPLATGNGVRITPQACLADVPTPEVAVVTDINVAPGTPLDARFEPVVAWLRQCHAAGGLLASACSGALVLAHTGLLDGLDATSHWAYCEHLRRSHPQVRWHADRGLVVGGEERRILMAGSGVSWHLLVLALIARFAGPQEAMRVARINLMDLNTTSPQAYASLTHGCHAADPLIARCQAWAAEHYGDPSPVARMVALSRLPERTFKRRFSLATGMAPLEYVQHVRLEEAKQMLEASELPVDAVALEVGYSDTSFFTRLFRRKVGLPPAQYRQRFGRLARELRSGDPVSG